MALRIRNGKWHYRFRLDGRDYWGSTDLAATRQNMSEAQTVEAANRTALIDGRRPTTRIVVREFNDARTEFDEWAKAEYRAHPASARRIAVSLTSAARFFDRQTVSMIDEGA